MNKRDPNFNIFAITIATCELSYLQESWPTKIQRNKFKIKVGSRRVEQIPQFISESEHLPAIDRIKRNSIVWMKTNTRMYDENCALILRTSQILLQ